MTVAVSVAVAVAVAVTVTVTVTVRATTAATAAAATAEEFLARPGQVFQRAQGLNIPFGKPLTSTKPQTFHGEDKPLLNPRPSMKSDPRPPRAPQGIYNYT